MSSGGPAITDIKTIAPDAPAAVTHVDALPRLPAFKLLLGGLALTACAFLASAAGDRTGRPLSEIFFSEFSQAASPTMAVAMLLLVGVWLLWHRRLLGIVLVMAFGMVALKLAYAHSDAAVARQKEVYEVARVRTAETVRLPKRLPLVFVGNNGIHPEALAGLPGVEGVVLDMGKDGLRRVDANRIDLSAGRPAERLEVRVGRASAFFRGAAYADKSPYELRYVAPGVDDLLAVRWRTQAPAPAVVPVLTLAGWYRPNDSLGSEGAGLVLRDFVAATIAKHRREDRP